MRFEVSLKDWEYRDGKFELHLSDRTSIEARKLIFSLGPWVKQILTELGVPIRVQRNVQCWFAPATTVYSAENFPAFLLERDGWPAPLYGFPDFGEGVKAAFHGWGELTEAQNLKREIDLANDVQPLVRAMEAWMPGAANTFREAKACMYSLTPDEHFVIDRHPAHHGLILCGGFSGHGFQIRARRRRNRGRSRTGRRHYARHRFSFAASVCVITRVANCSAWRKCSSLRPHRSMIKRITIWRRSRPCVKAPRSIASNATPSSIIHSRPN